jgi:hypothetical protein
MFIMSDQNAPTETLSPSRQVMQFLWPGAMAAEAICVAAKLGIADLLGEDLKSASELARAVGAEAATLARLLAALATMGIFSGNHEDGFRNTELSKTLRSDHPESMRNWAIFLGAPFVLRPLGELEQAVKTGATPFDRSFGKGFFDYLADNPSDSAIFNAAMSSGSSMSASAIVAAYDFSRFRQIIDVGGGHGALLEGILLANPMPHGVLFDLPSVVAGADSLRTGSLAGRCQVVGGDFFQFVPEGDAYLLKGIVHDWSDGDAERILRCCRRSISADGRLILLETVLRPHDKPASGMMDLLMLVLVGGRERTEQDFRALLGQGGFSLLRVIQAGPSFLLECAPL